MSNTNSENRDTSKIGKRNKFEDCLDAEGESKKNVAVDSLKMSTRLDKASDTTKGKLICICNMQKLASNI